MVPNHLFSLLTMIATEAPDSLDSEAVRAKKAKLLKPSGRYARRTPCAVNTQPAR
jgi:glucose-6-phosphate 1-dehydrogenase